MTDTVRLLADLRDVRSVVADAVQRNRCAVGDLVTELRGGPIRGSAMLRPVLGRWPMASGRPPRATCAT